MLYKIIILLVVFTSFIAKSQNESPNIVNGIELSIPSAPAFALLGVNPEIVLRPNDLKSFKVDWRVKNYNLAPDLALEGQPLWHLYYKKKSWKDYASLSSLGKKLSTISLSVGTAKIDGVNHASYAIKLNLYKKNDPFHNQEIINKLNWETSLQEKRLDRKIDSLISIRYKTTDPMVKQDIELQLEAIRLQKIVINQEALQKYSNVIEQIILENWNQSMLDFAFGSVYTYDNAGLDSLRVRHAGIGLWINGCLQAGKNGLLSGIIKYNSIHKNKNMLLGLGFRYGNARFNFYVEGAYEKLSNYFDPMAEQPFEDDEYFSSKFVEDVGNGWLDFNNEIATSQYTLAYGGDFKLSKNILLNFALRTQFTQNFNLTRLIPVANIACLMK